MLKHLSTSTRIKSSTSEGEMPRIGQWMLKSRARYSRSGNMAGTSMSEFSTWIYRTWFKRLSTADNLLTDRIKALAPSAGSIRNNKCRNRTFGRASFSHLSNGNNGPVYWIAIIAPRNRA